MYLIVHINILILQVKSMVFTIYCHHLNHVSSLCLDLDDSIIGTKENGSADSMSLTSNVIVGTFPSVSCIPISVQGHQSQDWEILGTVNNQPPDTC